MSRNLLSGAASPYLLAHADDPVNWFQWGAEPFAEAKRRNVPLFVSIGYATCHWCHVMARESFQSPQIARFLNDQFVAVKVDREEHPDVDSYFLDQASAITTRVGWPLNVIVAPDGRIGFAGSYLPPEPRGPLPSLGDVLSAASEKWRSGGFSAPVALNTAPRAELRLENALARLAADEDTLYGGFGTGSKFPTWPALQLLADVASLGDQQRGVQVDRALRAIVRSPLRDGIDGGLFRYATRRNWGDPHYERMLVDNAQALRLLALRSVAQTSAPAQDEFERAARGVADFLTQVLALPGGGFATAQDSESVVNGVPSEGGWFRLGAEERRAAAPPPIDDKLVTAHNGIAIQALTLAGRLLGEERWVDVARRTAVVLRDRHRRADGRILRASRASSEGIVASTAVATLEDHGLLAGGLLELAVVTGEPEWLSWATELVDAVIDGDRLRPPHVDPVLGAKTAGLLHEAASPSGPSAAGSAAWRLHVLTGEERYARVARAVVDDKASETAHRPTSSGALLSLALETSTPPQHLVVVDGDAALSEVARRHSRAGGLVAALPRTGIRSLVRAGAAALTGRELPGTAYLCENFSCRLPTKDPATLATALVAATQRPAVLERTIQ